MLEWRITSFEDKVWEFVVTKDSDHTSFYTAERLTGSGRWMFAVKGSDGIHRQLKLLDGTYTLSTILPVVMEIIKSHIETA